VLHRDLKPANIFVLDGDRSRGGVPAERISIKLLDFGLAKRFVALHDVSMGVFGSPVYAAPELVSGQPPSPASDLFSLGVIIYQMLSGQLPYDISADASLAELLLCPSVQAFVPLRQRAPSVSDEGRADRRALSRSRS
jgi:serine/threonine protein kinase